MARDDNLLTFLGSIAIGYLGMSLIEQNTRDMQPLPRVRNSRFNSDNNNFKFRSSASNMKNRYQHIRTSNASFKNNYNKIKRENLKSACRLNIRTKSSKGNRDKLIRCMRLRVANLRDILFPRSIYLKLYLYPTWEAE